MLKAFSFFSATEIRFGFNTVETVGDACKKLGLGSVLVVCDAFMIDSGMVKSVTLPLEADGITYKLFSDFEASPSVSQVEKAHAFMKEHKLDGVIGFGGGSSMDTAKAAAMLLTNPPPISQYFGVEVLPKPACPTIMIPTTAGTGSEVSNACIVRDDVTSNKSGILSRYLMADVAIIDPNMTLSMPPALTASTGMDALTHCIEGFVSNKSSDMTRLLHREGIRLICADLRNAVWNGSLEARYNVMLGATYAGWAMSAASVGACHAMAYPVEGKYHAPHGDTNAALLPAVMRYNVIGNLEKFADMAQAMGQNVCGLPRREAAFKAVEFVEMLAEDLNLKSLADIGMNQSDVHEFAKLAVANTRVMSLNPRKVSVEACEAIYRSAL